MRKAISFTIKLEVVLLLFFLGIMITSCSQGSETISYKNKAAEALQYCKANGMDTSFFVLIDMKIHSGKNRLFVWDFKQNSVNKSAICSHGSCNGKTGPGYTPTVPKFSNTPNSYCSSLGKYKIGKRGYSNWGIHINYKLHGLESTNNNAYKRIIVLHSFTAVPNEEIYPGYAPTSWGCPMVSNEMMRYLDKKLKLTKKPVLLWIIN